MADIAAAPMQPLLAAIAVGKSFGGPRVVDGLSLSLAAGEVLGVIGPNGAGKSTLFDLLAGTQRADAGTIMLGGQNLTRTSPEARVAAGMARSFQIPRPFARMTVLENVMTAAQRQTGEGMWSNVLHPRRVAAEERANVERARALIDFVTLSHLQGEPAGILSGGQRKLLELARVLMAEPRLILLDEPAAGVNPALLDLIVDRIAEINAQGIAVLLIEHNMEVVARLCPRVIVMAAGRALAEGSPRDVASRPEVVEVYLEGMSA